MLLECSFLSIFSCNSLDFWPLTTHIFVSDSQKRMGASKSISVVFSTSNSSTKKHSVIPNEPNQHKHFPIHTFGGQRDFLHHGINIIHGYTIYRRKIDYSASFAPSLSSINSNGIVIRFLQKLVSITGKKPVINSVSMSSLHVTD